MRVELLEMRCLLGGGIHAKSLTLDFISEVKTYANDWEGLLSFWNMGVRMSITHEVTLLALDTILGDSQPAFAQKSALLNLFIRGAYLATAGWALDLIHKHEITRVIKAKSGIEEGITNYQSSFCTCKSSTIVDAVGFTGGLFGSTLGALKADQLGFQGPVQFGMALSSSIIYQQLGIFVGHRLTHALHTEDCPTKPHA